MKNILESMRQFNHALVKASDLCSQLEYFIGCYFVSGNAIDDIVYDVYYDGAIDMEEESVALIPENLVAYVTVDGKYAFVLERIFDKFVADTAKFGFQYVSVSDFYAKEFCIDLSGEVPGLFQEITWIDDSFLYDENVEFDFEAYFRIDDGVRYLNPKHFSIHELISFLCR